MSTIERALAKKKASRIHEVELESALEKNIEQKNEAEQPEIANPQINTPISSLEQTNCLEINLAKLAYNDYIVPETMADNRALQEQFRQIKRKLLNNAFGVVSRTLDNPNLIMVTSAKADEGKTYIAINLALSIALEQDKKVLLIDADVLKPSVIYEFGRSGKSGLIEYLLGEKEQVSDIIYHTNIDNLKFIPAGTPNYLSNELLASERMATLAKELSTRYPDRVVIFDSPPLLGVTETSVLARLMGQVLIVAEENKTSVNQVNQACLLLPDELAKGLVINKAINSQKELYGYYGYGYGNKPEN
ncbi:XrtA-associated tyrosine autokinase [Thalassotalea fonticola]|uniref:non-specific protein-tyrosine kinase n=1 Tax=Thalassotalea fonticola TaxID=3065649 RepID=A0ABZ0GL62_9GAMM|nr:XrtA-associated tyrosine autokinase [Colwelliaceae bacterium S1-1]